MLLYFFVFLAVSFLIFGCIKFLFLRNTDDKGLRIIFIGMIGIVIYNLFVMYGHQSPYLSFIANRLTYTDALCFYMLIPLFFIALQKIMYRRPISSYKNAIHLWPLLPGLLYSVNFFSLSIPEQNEVVLGEKCGVLPDWILYGIGAFSVFLYLILSIRLVYRCNEMHGHELDSLSVKQLSFYIWLLYCCLILCVCFSFLTFCADSTEQIHNIILFLLVCLAAIISFLILYIKPKIFSFKQSQSEPCDLPNDDDTSYLYNLAHSIDYRLLDTKVYLNQHLSIADVAQNMSVTSTEISEAIKVRYNTSFQDFINRYRVMYAKSVLEQNSFVKMDILAYDSGFASRSTFYVSFKKHVGITPQEYKQKTSQ